MLSMPQVIEKSLFLFLRSEFFFSSAWSSTVLTRQQQCFSVARICFEIAQETTRHATRPPLLLRRAALADL